MGDLPKAAKPGKLTIYVRNGDHFCQPIFGENIPLIGSSGHKPPWRQGVTVWVTLSSVCTGHLKKKYRLFDIWFFLNALYFQNLHPSSVYTRHPFTPVIPLYLSSIYTRHPFTPVFCLLENRFHPLFFKILALKFLKIFVVTWV